MNGSRLYFTRRVKIVALEIDLGNILSPKTYTPVERYSITENGKENVFARPWDINVTRAAIFLFLIDSFST